LNLDSLSTRQIEFRGKRVIIYKMGSKSKLIKIIILVVIVAAAVAGYFYLKNIQKQPEEEAAAPLKASTPAVSGTLPSLDIQTNVLKNVPEINPVDKANPFKDVYKNPFE